jgi:teichuronic acid biosynthesis glycosyltransferase TuaG
MKKQVSVDIIIPVYNSGKFIKRAIKSVFSQTYKNWKLIIIDDASTDNSKNILNKIYNKNKYRIKILKNNINKGQAFSRNRGLKYSKSEFISFLDSDDYWGKNKLENQIKFMLNNNYDFTYTDFRIVKNNHRKKTIVVPDFYNYIKFIHNSSISTSSIVLKKKIIKNIYFKNLSFLEDYFFKCQILRKGFIAYKCPKSYIYYSIRKDSLQSNRLSVLFSLWNINKNLNKMKFIQNIFSIFLIVVNSLKKYGFR